LCDHRGYSFDESGNYKRCKCTLHGIRFSNLEEHVPSEYWAYTVDDFFGNNHLLSDPKRIDHVKLCVAWYCANIEKCIKDGTNMFIHGGPNSGKTMLAMIILQEAIAKGYTVLRCNFSDFISVSTRYNFPDFDLDDMYDKYCDPDVLVLDKVSLEDKKSTKGITFINSVFDRRLLEKKSTIITSRHSLEEIGDSFGSNMQAMLCDVKNIRTNVKSKLSNISKMKKDEIDDYVVFDNFSNGVPGNKNIGKTIHMNLGHKIEKDKMAEKRKIDKAIQILDKEKDADEAVETAAIKKESQKKSDKKGGLADLGI